MVHLDLTEDERAVLRELLALRSEELRHEIHHTDSRSFRTGLRHEEDVLLALLNRLDVQAPAVPH